MFNSVFVDILSDWIKEYQSSSSRPFSECQTRYRYAGSDLQLFLVAAELTGYGNLPFWLHVIDFGSTMDRLQSTKRRSKPIVFGKLDSPTKALAGQSQHQ